MRNYFNCFSLSFVILICVVYQCTARDPPSKYCQDKLNIPDADVLRLNQTREPISRSDECYLDCLYKDGEFIQDGKFNVEAVKKYITFQFKDEIKDLLLSIFSICSEQLKDFVPSYECELTAKLHACVSDQLKQAGYDNTVFNS